MDYSTRRKSVPSIKLSRLGIRRSKYDLFLSTPSATSFLISIHMKQEGRDCPQCTIILNMRSRKMLCHQAAEAACRTGGNGTGGLFWRCGSEQIFIAAHGGCPKRDGQCALCYPASYSNISKAAENVSASIRIISRENRSTAELIGEANHSLEILN